MPRGNIRAAVRVGLGLGLGRGLRMGLGLVLGFMNATVKALEGYVALALKVEPYPRFALVLALAVFSGTTLGQSLYTTTCKVV